VRSYRFGYVSSFTDSFIQVIDLDDSVSLPPSSQGAAGRTQDTFETFVFTLGNPTPPVGS
jgi:hypothetical protein